MPRSWSAAVKDCRRHPPRKGARACSCKVGWRYRLALPDPVTGLRGKPEWSRHFPSKTAADEDQRRVRQAITDKTFTHDRGRTVADACAEKLQRMRKLGRKESTVGGYEGVMQNHLIPHLGSHRLGDLRPDHVQAMLDRIAESPSQRTGKGERTPVTAGTLVNIRAVLRSTLSDEVRAGAIARNVATMVTLPPVKRAKPVAIEHDGLAAFLAQVEGDPLEAMWTVAVVYGPRRAELAGLRWDDVDVDRAVIRIRSTLLEVKGDHRCPHCGQTHRRLLFDNPKTAAGERIYPLIPSVAATLMEHRLRQDHDRSIYGSDYADHGLVFAQPSGDPWRPDWISREFRRHLKTSGAAMGMEKTPSLKALRSTAVTNLHAEGASLEVIGGVIGHAPGSDVTREHYLYVSAERSRAEFEALAAKVTASRSDRQSDRRPETGGQSTKGGTEK